MITFEGLDDDADEPLGNLTLKTWREQDENGEWQNFEHTVADSMVDLHKRLLQEQDALDSRWQQWSDAQTEMICLAVEVLGSANVSFEANVDIPENLVQNIGTAGLKRTNDDKTYVEAEESIIEFETELATLLNNKSKTMKAQQKVSLDPNTAQTTQLTLLSCRHGERKGRRCWKPSRKRWRISKV